MTGPLRKAAEQALEALNEVTGWQWSGPMRVMDEVEDAIQALRQALAQPEQEPVAKYRGKPNNCPLVNLYQDIPVGTLLYTAPPKREWKGLTSDDKHFLLANAWNKEQAFDGFMDAIDKFLEEKNT